MLLMPKNFILGYDQLIANTTIEQANGLRSGSKEYCKVCARKE